MRPTLWYPAVYKRMPCCCAAPLEVPPDIPGERTSPQEPLTESITAPPDVACIDTLARIDELDTFDDSEADSASSGDTTPGVVIAGRNTPSLPPVRVRARVSVCVCVHLFVYLCMCMCMRAHVHVLVCACLYEMRSGIYRARECTRSHYWNLQFLYSLHVIKISL